MSETLGEKNNFKAQYKTLKSSRAHKTDCYFPHLDFIALDFSPHRLCCLLKITAFHGSCTHLHPQVKTQKTNRTT